MNDINREADAPVAKRSSAKKIALGIFLFLAVVVAGFCGVVAMQPAEFAVTRTATMNAPPEEVFAQVNDFHKWEAWSPWAKLDPDSKSTFEGPESGEGAAFHWAGNDQVGEGNMKITESKPNDLILIDLEFLKPFPAKNLTEFTFKPEGEQTVVTWTMSGQNNFIGRAICMFMDMDGMVGGDFEKGLASIKAIVEAPDAHAPDAT